MRIKYAAFAKALGVARASVTMAIKNNQLEADTEDKLIDITIPENKIWIDKQIAKGKTWDLNRISEQAVGKAVYQQITNTKPEPQKGKVSKSTSTNNDKPKPKEEETDVQKYQKKLRALEYDRKLEDLKKTRNANMMDELKIRKMQGQLLPVDAAKGVFIFSIETMRTAFLQEVNAIANVFVERLGANNEQFKELQKDITEKVNDASKEGQENILEKLADKVSEYKEVRGRGESK